MKKSILVLITLLFVTTLSANGSMNIKSEMKYDLMVENLVIGITSDNDGLKRSSIYFAGKYQIEEVVDLLIEELEEATDANDRYLISLSLYLIGDKDGIEAIKRDNAKFYQHILKYEKSLDIGS